MTKIDYRQIKNLPQSDWNQNDSSAKDFIKGRTHYDETLSGDAAQVVFDDNVTLVGSLNIGYQASMEIADGDFRMPGGMFCFVVMYTRLPYIRPFFGFFVKACDGADVMQECIMDKDAENVLILLPSAGKTFLNLHISSSTAASLNLSDATETVYVKVAWFPVLADSATYMIVKELMGTSATSFFENVGANKYKYPCSEFSAALNSVKDQLSKDWDLGPGAQVAVFINDGDEVTVTLEDGILNGVGKTCAGNKWLYDPGSYTDTGEDFFIYIPDGESPWLEAFIRSSVEVTSFVVKPLSVTVTHKLPRKYLDIPEELPPYSNTDKGKILRVNGSANGVEWGPAPKPRCAVCLFLDQGSGNTYRDNAVSLLEGKGYEHYILIDANDHISYDNTLGKFQFEGNEIWTHVSSGDSGLDAMLSNDSSNSANDRLAFGVISGDTDFDFDLFGFFREPEYDDNTGEPTGGYTEGIAPIRPENDEMFGEVLYQLLVVQNNTYPSVICCRKRTMAGEHGIIFYLSIGNAALEDRLNSIRYLDDVSLSSLANGQVLTYNAATGKWENSTPGGGSASPVIVHTANSTVSTSTATITFASDARRSQMISVSADIGIAFAVENLSDNYLWIKNTGSSDIDVTINSVTHAGSSVAHVYLPADGISIPKGGVCEIGIIVNADGAFITSRSDMSTT